MKAEANEQSLQQQLIDYLEVPLRRPWHVMLPLVLVTGLAVAASFLLAKKYRTSTLILVESQKVPESFVKPGTQDPRPRLQTIRQEILSRTRLETIIKELDPYPQMAARVPLTSIVETMRAAVEINVKGNDAFSIDYVHGDPKKAQAVANRLAGLFIEESTRARQEQVSGTASFIEVQLEESRKQLEQKDKDIRRYKEAHLGRLPEQTSANLATLQRMQLEQQSTNDGLRAARDRMMMLERGLLEIDAAKSSAASPAAQLNHLRIELGTLRERYTDEHPDVRRQLGRIARLEKQIQDAARGDTTAVAGRTQLEQARADVESLEAKLADSERRIANFQQRVEDAPRTEQELATLTRDYQKLSENYSTLQQKKLDAQMAERLEQRWKGEQFRVLDPAYLPEQPFFPNHLLFLGVGLFVGLLAGLAAAVVAEFMDGSIKNLREVESLLPYPVLATIPAIDGNGPARGGPRRLLGRRRRARAREHVR